jgi:hypothetical protein
MAMPHLESPDRTDLKQIDHERFFEAIDFPPLPTEARETYETQVALLVRVLPHVAGENVFALKGGTAINLF